jgi:hypothetical protein
MAPFAVHAQPGAMNVLVASAAGPFDFRKILDVVTVQAPGPRVESRKRVSRFVVLETDVPERCGHMALLTGTFQLFMGAFVCGCLLGAGHTGGNHQESAQQDIDEPLIQFSTPVLPVFNRRLSVV